MSDEVRGSPGFGTVMSIVSSNPAGRVLSNDCLKFYLPLGPAVNEARIVVLSEAKDLIAACHGHEILRYAQDDRRTAPDQRRL